MKELFEALAKVHEEIKNPKRKKKVTVKHKAGGQHSFMYAPLDEIIEDTRPILAKNGLSILQSVEPQEGKDYLITQINHLSGEFIRSMLPFGAIPTDPKEYGARLTYLKRYGMCAALNIAAEDDNDAPPKMTGKFGKTALRAQISKFNIGIGEQSTSEELSGHYNNFKEAIEQAKVDMPGLINGGEGEGLMSVEEHYKTTMNALVIMEKQEKLHTESFKSTT